MGGFITYLHLAHGLRNFFVLAPNLTIYDKLIRDFTPNTPKYVLNGISEFAAAPPVITTGEKLPTADRRQPRSVHDDDQHPQHRQDQLPSCAEVARRRYAASAKEIGESYFDHLAGQKDLVLIMDESHRYRASSGIRVLNELKPLIGLELTANAIRGGARRSRLVQERRLRLSACEGHADGFVKQPAVVTRQDFDPAGKSRETLDDIKLQDGIRLHEDVKVQLETYALQTGQRIVKPLVLVIARDTTHARDLMALITSDAFFSGRYAEKVIQVDSSIREDETIQRLLRVEQTDEPTEIVIHVNMLKEGWDVVNLYTIVPLRAANARTLIEQSIGRGLRLPYGRRTGVSAVDRLNIVAHDRFQEIVDEARRPDSVIRLERIVLSHDDLHGVP